MGRIVTQSKLNELVNAEIDLGRGGRYCPTYKEIVDNWQSAASTITATLAECKFWYDGSADDTYCRCKIVLSEPAPVDLEVNVAYGNTPSAMNESIYVYIDEGKSEVTYTEGGHYQDEGYAKIIAILDWDGYETDVKPDGKTLSLGKFEKDSNVGYPYVDSNLNPKVTFTYPVKSNITVKISWEEEDSYGSILCGNYVTVVVKQGETTAQSHAGWNCGGQAVGNAEIECTPYEDDYFIYE